MKYAILACLAACTTTQPQPGAPVQEVEYCATVPTNKKDVQFCAMPKGIICFMYESGISCVRPIITSKA